MANVSSFFKKAVEFKAGDVKDSVQFEYVKKNGIFKVTVGRLLGVQGDTSVQVHMDFPITGTDQMLTCKELTEYTDKQTGQLVESKGANIIRAMVGMVSGKANAKAQWASEKGRVYGKEVEGFTLPTLIGKPLYIAVQVERSIYNNKAQEECVIRRILSEDGYSLAEYEEALKELKDGTITKLSEYKGTALEKEQGKTRKYKYKGCTEEEWNEANGSSTNGQHPADENDDELPTIDTDDALPEIDVSSDNSSTKTIKPTTDSDSLPEIVDNGNDALPTITIDLD